MGRRVVGWPGEEPNIEEQAREMTAVWYQTSRYGCGFSRRPLQLQAGKALETEIIIEGLLLPRLGMKALS